MVKDTKDNEYTTYIMEHNLKWNGAYAGTIKSFALTKTQSAYKEVVTLQKWKRKTELAVDKINGTISSIIEETDEYENKLTQIEQTVDSINQNVGNIIDYKHKVEGVTEIHLEDAGENDIIQLQVQGNKTYESILFPRRKYISK